METTGRAHDPGFLAHGLMQHCSSPSCQARRGLSRGRKRGVGFRLSPEKEGPTYPKTLLHFLKLLLCRVLARHLQSTIKTQQGTCLTSSWSPPLGGSGGDLSEHLLSNSQAVCFGPCSLGEEPQISIIYCAKLVKEC